MRYTLYKLKSPYGEPEETLLETNSRPRMVRKVADLLMEGYSAEYLRMVEDKSIPEPEINMEGYFD